MCSPVWTARRPAARRTPRPPHWAALCETRGWSWKSSRSVKIRNFLIWDADHSCRLTSELIPELKSRTEINRTNQTFRSRFSKINVWRYYWAPKCRASTGSPTMSRLSPSGWRRWCITTRSFSSNRKISNEHWTKLNLFSHLRSSSPNFELMNFEALARRSG